MKSNSYLGLVDSHLLISRSPSFFCSVDSDFGSNISRSRPTLSPSQPCLSRLPMMRLLTSSVFHCENIYFQMLKLMFSSIRSLQLDLHSKYSSDKPADILHRISLKNGVFDWTLSEYKPRGFGGGAMSSLCTG